VAPLVARITEELNKLGVLYEIVLVEDGSPDDSWTKIVAEGEQNRHVRGVKLSRNFGQHAAISAGLHESRGDYVVVIDCDLQEDPRYIAALLEEARKGFDIVYARRESRSHSRFKNLGALFFNTAFNWLSENKQVNSRADVGSYSILSRRVVEAFRQINDYHRHYLLVVRWLGFRSSYIEVEHNKRLEGRSSYSVRKLIRHAIDGITSQSTRLLRISIAIGLLFFCAAILAAILLIVLYFTQGLREGWTSVMVLILLSTGMIMMSLGIIGIYLGKAFEQVKGRPLYIVETRVN